MDENQISGQFQKGKSGNPAGRPKGARNKIIVRREAVESAVIKAAAGNLENLTLLMQTTIDDALNHTEESFRMANRKLVFDTFIPKARAPDVDKDENKDNTLVIKIDTVNLGPQGIIKDVIEGSFKQDIEDEQG